MIHKQVSEDYSRLVAYIVGDLSINILKQKDLVSKLGSDYPVYGVQMTDYHDIPEYCS